MLKKLGQTPAAAGGIRPQMDVPALEENRSEKTAATKKQESQSSASGYEYIVRTMEVQKGMSANSTMLALESADRKIITAFARGEHPDLIPGAMLTKVKLVTRRQDTVVFQVLEAYQVMNPRQQAA